MSRRPRGPISPMGAIFGGAFFATLIFGWLWIGQLAAVGLGWQPIADTAQRIAQAVRP